MDLDPQKVRYPALGFVITAAFIGCLGWMLFEDVVRPSMQPAVDHVETGSIHR